MDFLQKLKTKLGEEMSESEREDAMGPGGSPKKNGNRGAPSEQELEQQVAEMKEHINKNYYIYKRKMEKRRNRIKELEEYAKLLIKDNEALQEKQKNFDELQHQLATTRENLDQLEGFQGQELAKVKHMLLSAETALEREREERKRLQEEAKHFTSAEVRFQNYCCI